MFHPILNNKKGGEGNMLKKIYYNDNDSDINLFLNFLGTIFLNFYISPNTDLSFFAVSQPHFLKCYL